MCDTNYNCDLELTNFVEMSPTKKRKHKDLKKKMLLNKMDKNYTTKSPNSVSFMKSSTSSTSLNSLKFDNSPNSVSITNYPILSNSLNFVKSSELCEYNKNKLNPKILIKKIHISKKLETQLKSISQMKFIAKNMNHTIVNSDISIIEKLFLESKLVKNIKVSFLTCDKNQKCKVFDKIINEFNDVYLNETNFSFLIIGELNDCNFSKINKLLNSKYVVNKIPFLIGKHHFEIFGL
jgi:hypothetical protein